MFLGPHYYMVQNFDLEQLAGTNQVPCDFDVSFRGIGMTARMIVGQDETAAGKGEYGPEDMKWRGWAGIQTAECHQIVTDDTFAGVEHQDDQSFLHRIVPVSFGDVLLPITGDLFRTVQQFSHGFTFPQRHDFKLTGGVAIQMQSFLNEKSRKQLASGSRFMFGFTSGW